MNFFESGRTFRVMLMGATILSAVPAMASDGNAPVQPPATAQVEDVQDDNIAVPADDDDIIVTAPRIAGQLDTSISAEIELDEAAISSFGASSVTDILAALAPQTRSGRGRGSGRPIILVNGRRISGFGEIRNLPSEAIAKVEVFPEEVALQYGYAADQRVVNFVLKSGFRQFTVEDELGAATQGGRLRNELEPNFLTISKNGRVNLTGGWERDGMLRESERKLAPLTGVAADASLRSLLAASDLYKLEGTVQRSLDKTTDVSLNLGFEQTDSLSLLGNDGTGRALERDSRSRSLTGGAGINGMLGNWRWSLTGNYADSDQHILTDRIGGSRDQFDSSQQSFGASGTASGQLVDGWAGPARLTLTGGYSGLRFDSRTLRGGGATTTDLARDVTSGTAALSLPLLDPDYEVGNLGRVTLSANLGVQHVSDFSTLTSWGSNLNWNLTDALSFLVSYNNDRAAPVIQQLGAAPLITPAVTYYDFARGETVQIETLSGGNPLLKAEKQRDFKLAVNWSPPMVEGLSLSVNYNRNQSDDTANSFPLLTPEIEAAFPGRVTRDASGRLVRIDLRPVNFDRTTNAQIRWGINFGRSFGQPQARGPGGPGGGAGAAPGGPGAAPGGAPRARPPGGPGGPGRFGGFGGGPQGGRWQVSLYHTIKLEDRILIRPGVPELDRLNGSATGNDGGSNRHLIEADGGWFNKGLGVRFSARYDSGSRVRGGLTGGDLKFGDLATFNLRTFLVLDQQPKLLKALPFLKGTHLSFSVNNLFDAQRRVTDGNGTVPLRYQPGFIDPLGRYVEIELRKRF